MKNLSVVIIGGGAGLGLLMADMAVEYGAAGIGIIDINGDAAEAALATAKAAGLRTASASCDICNGADAHAAFAAVAAE